MVFLCGWYPSRVLPNNGDFIQRHAEAVGIVNNVSVIHIISDPLTKKEIEISKSTTKNIVTYIAYIKVVNSSIKKGILFTKAFKILLEKIGHFDIIHLNKLYPFGIFALYLKWFYKKPFLISEHWTGYQSLLVNNISKLELFFSKIIAKKANFICPVSDNLKEAMITKGLMGNYQKVPNVVDCDLFNPSNSKQETFTIIHASNMNDSHKNISGLLNIIREFSLKVSNFEFLLIGENSTKYEKKVMALGIQKNVKFIDHISHAKIAKELKRAHAFVLFSNYENLPCVILESFSCGIPVISTNVGGIAEYFPKDFGFLVESGNEKEFVEALLKLFYSYTPNPNTMHTYVKELFSKISIAKKFQSLYNKIVNERS